MLAVGAVLTLSACHRPLPAPAPPAAVVAFVVHPCPPSERGESLHYPIEVAARYANAMSFRVDGKLIERRVRLGDSVQKGEVVARLDAADAEKRLASARAALDAAEHRLRFAKQQIDRDQAQFAQHLIAENQLEQTEDSYHAALDARAQSADELALAENVLAYHTLVADHSGFITSENADTGQVISAGQAIYGLAWNDDIDVILDAAASDVERIAIGQAAAVTFGALGPLRFAARVREVSAAADPESRTYRVKLTLAKPGAAVRLGMTGEATLEPGASSDAAPTSAPLFKIPGTALFHQGKDPAVWVIRGTDSILELRRVEVQKYGERTALVSAGLRDGESILAAGVHTVYEGEHVKPVPPLFAGDDESAR